MLLHAHVAGITSSIAQMRKLSPTEVKNLTLGHTARCGRAGQRGSSWALAGYTIHGALDPSGQPMGEEASRPFHRWKTQVYTVEGLTLGEVSSSRLWVL